MTALEQDKSIFKTRAQMKVCFLTSEMLTKQQDGEESVCEENLVFALNEVIKLIESCDCVIKANEQRKIMHHLTVLAELESVPVASFICYENIVRDNINQGPPGERGLKGEKGDPGVGIMGPRGEKGEKGDSIIGERGPQGEQGLPGIGTMGPQGVPGIQGIPGVGIKGDKGDKGDTGIGIKGDKGDKGDPGGKGEKGDIGASGQIQLQYEDVDVTQRAKLNLKSPEFVLIDNEDNNSTDLFFVPDEINLANCLFVSPSGDDLNAKYGSIRKPWRTLKKAHNDAPGGYTIFVLPGVYTDFNLGKDNVHWHFFKGAVVQPVNATNSPIFTDAITNQPLRFNVTGHGRFISLGVHDNDSSCFEARRNGTIMNVEAELVSSMEIWNGSSAKMIFRNTEFTQETAIYGAGGAEFYNCFFNNSIQYWAMYANLTNPVLGTNIIKCVNCRFLTTTALPPGYSGNEIPNQGLEASNILFQNGSWATSARAKGKVYLQGCTFESFQHNIQFNILTENSDITLMVKDCLFKSSDPTKFSIRHVKTHNNNDPNVKFLLYNSNYATNNTGGSQPVENKIPGPGLIVDPNVDLITAA